ncbi:MAG: hypothetical protein GEV12_19125 [Micromonosporaceae bacterium]|nr:hypothetical protein [Micromonosporaceae bacterium]
MPDDHDTARQPPTAHPLREPAEPIRLATAPAGPRRRRDSTGLPRPSWVRGDSTTTAQALSRALLAAAQATTEPSLDVALPPQIRRLLRELDILLAAAAGWIEGTSEAMGQRR